ncbi:T9SS type A sorting domain-containing protein, partial [bacterium]|nr:T9SS type A sorting domain-containing protein [bacterium]
EYLQEIDQPTSSAFGFRDLTTIEGKIYGSENVWIIGIDENGEVIDSIHGIHNPNRALAYDPDRDWIWIGNDRADIVAINRAGEEQVRFEQDYHVFALGYNPADPDDKPLYLFHWDDGGGLANAVVSKMDVETGEIVQETLIAQDDPNNIILGAEVVSDLEGVDGYWVAPVLIMNSAENLGYLHLHKVETAVPMLRGIPMHGTIQVDDSDNPLLHLNSEGVTAGNYRGTIDVQYNGVDSPMSRNFVLRVVSVSTESESPKLPQKFTMSDPYPNPFNSTIQVNYSVPNPAEVKVKIYNLQGQLLYNASHDVNAGNHNFVWHANTNKGAEVASGIYLLQVSSADFISTGKIVLIR